MTLHRFSFRAIALGAWLFAGTLNAQITFNFTYTGTSMIDMTPIQGDGSGNYGSTWTDFDDDGDIDLYISKCRQNVNDPTDHRRINVLYENDGNGNYTFGLNEQSMFHEIDQDKIDRVRGMDITVVTTAKTDAEGRALLRLLGFPFKEA